MEQFYGQFNPPTDYIISLYFPSGYVGIALDIGATDGIYINNTFYFEKKGWNVLCVEANPSYEEQLKAQRKNTLICAISNVNADNVPFHVVHMLEQDNLSSISSLVIDQKLLEEHQKILTCNQYDITVNARTIDYCITQFNPQKIDFVSIDIEGTELEALKGFDIIRWKPKLFIIENNYNDDLVENYLKKFGYYKHQRQEVNDFFIRY